MYVPTFQVNISASIVAAYAAAMSSVTGAVQLANFLRDRSRIRVSVQRDMELLGDPRYRGMTLTMVTVVNVGRRPVTITNVGAFYLYPGKAFIITDCNPKIPCELTEGKRLMALADQSDINFAEIESWQAYDAIEIG